MSNQLTISITRVSPTHHRLSYTRVDGTSETKELESKSFLAHDFLHFCIEKEAGLPNGFWGALASGQTYDSLTMPSSEEESGAHDIEPIVGILTSLTKGEADIEKMVSSAENVFSAYHRPVPPWFGAGFIKRVAERYRTLIGEWNSLPFGETLTLVF